MLNWLKRLAGVEPEEAKNVQQTIDDLFRYDQGPTNPNYLRRLFPRSIFTKKITPARAQRIREILRRMRPEQRRVVYRMGWNKGVVV